MALLAWITAVTIAAIDDSGPTRPAFAPPPAPGTLTPSLARLAGTHPDRPVDVIVQLTAGTDIARGDALVHAAQGKVTGALPIINAVSARMSAGAAAELARRRGVRAVSLDGKVTSSGYEGGLDKDRLATAFNHSIGADNVWFNNNGRTARGVGVAVLDTGIAGGLRDFRASEKSTTSRVVASVVTNPNTDNAADGYGHGTHVAGLIAGHGGYRTSKDPLDGRYAGAAPDASLINVKVSDDDGNVTVLDVIRGLQFVVDHKDTYNIRVANLSLNSTVAESYKTDPLDAAVEATWNAGVVVVTAAGNMGTSSDAVSYAPANDPYVITVGGVDDRGTKDISDDVLASWSSRGVTQDRVAKPEILAPGAHLVAPLAPGSDFARECPSCVVSNQYLRIGGTSMAAAVVSGAAALLIEEHPEWTPNEVKAAMIDKRRPVPGTGDEVAVDDARGASGDGLLANADLVPSSFIDLATGTVDWTRARSSSTGSGDTTRARSSSVTWMQAASPAWGGASWACSSCTGATDIAALDRARSSRARSSASFAK